MSNLNVMPKEQQVDDIDLGKLFGILVDHRWGIVAITFAAITFGIMKALLSAPVYQADALIQVEQKSTGLSALVGIGEGLNQESSTIAEIELIKSRMVLGETVDNLNLTVIAEPEFFPLFGKGFARLSGKQPKLVVPRLEQTVAIPIFLVIKDATVGSYILYDQQDNILGSGVSGELISNGDIKLFVSQLQGENGQRFIIRKQSRLNAIAMLQNNLNIYEKGNGTGILQLTMTGEDPLFVQRVLGDISENYFLQNVARKTAEAENGLEFLNGQLPDVKDKLTKSEDKLNAYRLENDSVDLGMEASATLKSIVQLEAQLNELTFKETELAKRFTQKHPSYIVLLDKRQHLMEQRKQLNEQIHRLPKTQQDILRLTRDVEVNQQIYLQLLNKAQELRLVKAGTVGNVRIIDPAQTGPTPIAPRKKLIVVLATFLGLMIGIAQAFLRAAFSRGVENPSEIEAIGLPVYASVPMSDWQTELERKQKGKKKLSIDETLLAISNPADLSIEALRSLRTSLHFAMMEAKNNILMISGPSPSIGKSFISANMAAVIAKSGQKVLVIDADMRKGRMEKQMSISPKPGLSDYLSGQKDIDSLVKHPGVENLEYIGRGEVPPNPSELLMHPRFNTLMDWASENYDIVIVDTPPILAVTDPAIVGAHAGTTLLVGRFGQNEVKEIEVTKQRFEQNGIEVKGFILNAVVRKATSYYGGNYGYYNYSYESK